MKKPTRLILGLALLLGIAVPVAKSEQVAVAFLVSLLPVILLGMLNVAKGAVNYVKSTQSALKRCAAAVLAIVSLIALTVVEAGLVLSAKELGRFL